MSQQTQKKVLIYIQSIFKSSSAQKQTKNIDELSKILKHN